METTLDKLHPDDKLLTVEECTAMVNRKEFVAFTDALDAVVRKLQHIEARLFLVEGATRKPRA